MITNTVNQKKKKKVFHYYAKMRIYLITQIY